MPNITSKELLQKFTEAMSVSVTFRHLGTPDNPCHILFEGVEYYVYIKNLSSAHFKGSPDVWRAQMTAVNVLDNIKDTDALFVLLGYDVENDVYATWNPHQVKQRIGTAKSPSLYSRLSLQQEASQTGEFKRKELNNDGDVLVFPSTKIVDYLIGIDNFFPDTSEYVAIGSKKRVAANEAYKELTDITSLRDFAKYLSLLQDNQCDITSYCAAIKTLINNNYISRYRKIFLAYDSIRDYGKAADNFLGMEEIIMVNKKAEHIYSQAFPKFIEFLNMRQEKSFFNDVEKFNDIKVGLLQQNNDVGYESQHIDIKGRLTKITNPQIIELLKPYLHTEYPTLPPAYNIVNDFYGERFPDMQLKDWGKLFREIQWE